jgi:DNA-binding NtrC family response regulator
LIERARAILTGMSVELTFASSPAELGVAVNRFGPHDLFVMNVSPQMSGWETAEVLRRTSRGTRVVALVDGPDDPRIAHLTESGNIECVSRPRDGASLNELLARLFRATTKLAGSEGTAAVEPQTRFHDIVGRSKQMQRIFSLIEKVASGDVNVCIYGESGTGKELIAQAVHASSARSDRPMVTLDCTAIPEGLMESQLFGHVKGAFTGATDHREGVFSLANTGTLFMDELGELGLPLQAKLLRVIQAREFSRSGAASP